MSAPCMIKDCAYCSLSRLSPAKQQQHRPSARRTGRTSMGIGPITLYVGGILVLLLFFGNWLLGPTLMLVSTALVFVIGMYALWRSSKSQPTDE